MAEIVNLREHRLKQQKATRADGVGQREPKTLTGIEATQWAFSQIANTSGLNSALIEAMIAVPALQEKLNRLIERHERKIAENRGLTSSYTDELLQSLLKRATDEMLQRAPYFYYAVLDEVTIRFGKTLQE